MYCKRQGIGCAFVVFAAIRSSACCTVVGAGPTQFPGTAGVYEPDAAEASSQCPEPSETKVFPTAVPPNP